MPERMSEYMPDRMSEYMPDRMSEYMPDRMSEYMPDRMSEYMPDRMSEYTYIYIYINLIHIDIYNINFQMLWQSGSHSKVFSAGPSSAPGAPGAPGLRRLGSLKANSADESCVLVGNHWELRKMDPEKLT